MRSDWNRERCIQAVDTFVQKHGRTPRQEEWGEEYGLPLIAAFYLHVGESCHRYCKAQYPGLVRPGSTQHWDRDSCILALENFIQVHGRAPLKHECTKANGLPADYTFAKYVGRSCVQYAQGDRARPTSPDAQWTRERCIQRVEAFIEVNGRRPSSKEYGENPELPDSATFRAVVGELPNSYIDKHRQEVPRYDGNFPPWNRYRCETSLHSFIRIHGRRPENRDFAEHTSLALPPIFAKYVKLMYDDYLNTWYPELETTANPLESCWTREWCELACERFIQIRHRAPKGFECNSSNGLPPSPDITHLMGKSVIEMQRERFPDMSLKSSGGWTDEQIHEAIRGWVNEHGKPPLATDLENSPNMPHSNTIRNHFGLRYSEYIKQYFPDIPLNDGKERVRQQAPLTREECKTAIAAFIAKNGYAPTASSLQKTIGIPAHTEFPRLMGMPLTQYLEENHPGVQYGRKKVYTRKECEEAYHRFVEAHRYLPHSGDFAVDGTLPNIMTFTRHMGMTPKAYGEEHFPHLIGAQRAWTKEMCTEALERFIARLGRLPTDAEYGSNFGLPPAKTFRSLLGVDYATYLAEHYSDMPIPAKPENPRRSWSRASCIQALERRMGGLPKNKVFSIAQIVHEKQMPYLDTFELHVGQTYSEYIQQHFPGRIRQHWDRETCIEALEAYVARCREEKRPIGNPWEEPEMPSASTFYEHVGCSYHRYLSGLRPDPLGKWNRESCIAAVEDCVRKLGTRELVEADLMSTGLPSNMVFRRYVGMGYMDYCRAHHPELRIRGGPSQSFWDRQSCIEAVDAHIKALGKQELFTADFQEQGLPDSRTFRKYVGMSLLGYCRAHHPGLLIRGGHIPKVWSRASCIDAVDRRVRELMGQGKIQMAEFNAPGLPSAQSFRNHAGKTILEYIQERYPHVPIDVKRRHWNRDSCIAAMDAFVSTHGRLPQGKEMMAGNGLPGAGALKNHTGMTMRAFCMERYPELYADNAITPWKHAKYSRRWDRESCIAAVDRRIGELDRPALTLRDLRGPDMPGANAFQRHTGLRLMEYCRERYPEIAFTYGTSKVDWTRDSCLAAVDHFVEKHKRPPTNAEMRTRRDIPNWKDFHQQCGETYADFFKARYSELGPLEAHRRPWDKDSCIAAVTEFVEKNGRLPKSGERGTRHGLPGDRTFQRHMGMTIIQCAKERFPQLYKSSAKWDADSCIDALEDFIKLHGRTPRSNECNIQNGLASYELFTKYVGQSYSKYIPENYSQMSGGTRYNNVWDKDRCIAALDAFVKEHGSPPSARDFSPKHNMPHQKTFEQHVGVPCSVYISRHYQELLVKKQKERIWSKERCEQVLAAFVEQHGRVPGYKEIKPANGLPYPGVFLSHVGLTYKQYMEAHYPDLGIRTRWNKEKCIHALTEYIKAHGHVPNNLQCRKENGLPAANYFTKFLGMPQAQYARKHMGDLLNEFAQGGPWWSREKCTAALDAYIRKTGKAPEAADCRSHNGLASSTAFCKYVGMTYTQYILRQYPRLNRESSWNRERCEAALTAFVSKTGRTPRCVDCLAINGLPSYTVFYTHLGMGPSRYVNEKLPHLLRQAGPLPPTAQTQAGGARRELPQEKNTARESTSAPQSPKRRAPKRKKEEPAQTWNRESATRAIEGFMKAHGRFPKEEEFTTENGLPSFLNAKRMLDSDYRAMHREFTVAYLREQEEAALTEQEAPDGEEMEQDDLALAVSL